MSRAMLKADRVFKPVPPETTEYAKEQKAFDDNRKRLKAERQAREATAAEKVRTKSGMRCTAS